MIMKVQLTDIALLLTEHKLSDGISLDDVVIAFEGTDKNHSIVLSQ